MRVEKELMRGAGPLAVLHLLSTGEKYGYELIERLSKATDGVLEMGQSTLYPMLYNLEAKGLITSRLDESGARSRRYYSLTKEGRARLNEDMKQWQALLKAMISLGLGPNPAALTIG
jgi:PadR family transcriptional regulator PadR